MNVFKWLTFSLLIISVFTAEATTNTTATEAPIACELTKNAELQAEASPCFKKLTRIISCMGPLEQELWVTANKNNKDSTRCFDCSYVKQSLKPLAVKHVNGITSTLGDFLKKQRVGLSCLKSFAEHNLSTKNIASINTELSAFVNIQKKTAKCYSKAFAGIEKVLIARRRILCSTTANMEKVEVAYDGIVIDFKYNKDEAKMMVDNYLAYLECRSYVGASMVNVINYATSFIPSSTTCSSDTAVKASDIFNLPEVSTYSASLISLIAAINTPKMKALNTKLTASFAPNSRLNCQQADLNQFVENIDNNNVTSYFDTYLRQFHINNCTAGKNFVYTIENSILSCEGNCPQGFADVTLTFKDKTKVPATYYYAYGCLGDVKFLYGTYADSRDVRNTSSNIVTLLTYQYTSQFDLNQVCLKRGKYCSEKFSILSMCPLYGLKTTCTDELTKKCVNSGLKPTVEESVGVKSNP